MEMQAELDAQEDHDRWTLQLYLQLEREHLPALHRAVSGAVEKCGSPVGCGASARQDAERALSDFGEHAHRHSHAMLQALQRQGSRSRKRAHELASSILSQAKSDRERLLTNRDAGWSDADLEGPLIALARQLRRPNATFELPLETLKEWEGAGHEALARGGAPDAMLSRKLLHLAAAAPLQQNDRTRTAMLHAEDPTTAFITLLQRARLHRHVPQLLETLLGWERRERPVWDVVELIETLRAQHVFPMSMLRLAEHEWDQIVGDASDQIGRPPHSFDADQ